MFLRLLLRLFRLWRRLVWHKARPCPAWVAILFHPTGINSAKHLRKERPQTQVSYDASAKKYPKNSLRGLAPKNPAFGARESLFVHSNYLRNYLNLNGAVRSRPRVANALVVKVFAQEAGATRGRRAAWTSYF